MTHYLVWAYGDIAITAYNIIAHHDIVHYILQILTKLCVNEYNSIVSILELMTNGHMGIANDKVQISRGVTVKPFLYNNSVIKLTKSNFDICSGLLHHTPITDECNLLYFVKPAFLLLFLQNDSKPQYYQKNRMCRATSDYIIYHDNKEYMVYIAHYEIYSTHYEIYSRFNNPDTVRNLMDGR